jgi:hypothetical protein
MPATQRKPHPQRVGAEQAADQQIAELAASAVGGKSAEGEQERRGQHPGVGAYNRREVAQSPVEGWGAVGCSVPPRVRVRQAPFREA